MEHKLLVGTFTSMGDMWDWREATAADVTAAFLARCEADGSAEKVRRDLASPLKEARGDGLVAKRLLSILGLSALLDAKGA